jgi:hypothetical protein
MTKYKVACHALIPSHGEIEWALGREGGFLMGLTPKIEFAVYATPHAGFTLVDRLGNLGFAFSFPPVAREAPPYICDLVVFRPGDSFSLGDVISFADNNRIDKAVVRNLFYYLLRAQLSGRSRYQLAQSPGELLLGDPPKFPPIEFGVEL